MERPPKIRKALNHVAVAAQLAVDDVDDILWDITYPADANSPAKASSSIPIGVCNTPASTPVSQ